MSWRVEEVAVQTELVKACMLGATDREVVLEPLEAPGCSSDLSKHTHLHTHRLLYPQQIESDNTAPVSPWRPTAQLFILHLNFLCV